ncbi:MAG: serine/threonine-protein phosphatase, partial [Catenulispora sp.]|nr:serine/threonine-protein phosphatase [Catenulispora sp.]
TETETDAAAADDAVAGFAAGADAASTDAASTDAAAAETAPDAQSTANGAGPDPQTAANGVEPAAAAGPALGLGVYRTDPASPAGDPSRPAPDTVPETAALADGAEEEAEPAMPLQLACPNCGATDLVMDSGSRFCEECGYALAEPVTGEEEPAVAAGPRPCVSCGGTEIDAEGYCVDCGDLQPRRRDRMEVDLRVVAGISDRGRRHHRNEDSMALRPAVTPDGRTVIVAVVCDGVSTSERPDEASAAAVSAAARLLLTAVQAGEGAAEELTAQAVRTADAAVAALSRDSDHGNPPACTYVSALVGADTGITVGWLGDSRAYWLAADGGSRQLTRDDAEEGSHAIEAWLGDDSGAPEPHVLSFVPSGPGVVLVCSDGLWNYVEAAADLAALALPEALTEPMPAATRLVRTALDAGGHDNITAVLVPYPVPAPADQSA